MSVADPILVGLVRGPGRGANVYLHPGEQIILGRHSACDLPVPDREVSSQHASLSFTARGLVALDLNSANGSSLGGAPLRGPTVIRPGQALQLGSRSAALICEPDPEMLREPGLRLIRLLGAGAYARVYEVSWPEPPGRVALKVLNLLHDPKDRLRAEREARLLGALRHPAIPRLLRAQELSGRFTLACELVTGQPLDRYIASAGPLPWPLALDLTRAAAEALSAAHSQGVIHRDLKPANLIIEDGTRLLKIIDFGHGRRLIPSSQSVQLTSLHEVLGSEEYLPPEALDPSVEPAPPVDIYALGATLAELLTGSPPCAASGDLRAPRQLGPLPPGAPERLRPLLASCLAPRPQDRPSSMAAFAAQLAALAPMQGP